MKREFRWGAENRLKLIEFQLFWHGTINRGDLVNVFRISIPQASYDLKAYKEKAPQNIIYDPRGKTYRCGEDFRPIFGEPQADDYLRSLHEGEPSEGTLPVLNGPTFENLPKITRNINTETLRVIVRSIRNLQAVKVFYQSTTKPEPRWRWITPHSLVMANNRLHTRAYCHESKKFKDFNLGRILKTGPREESDFYASSDLGWNTTVPFRLRPNPNLSEGLQRSTETEFNMVNGELVLKVRVSLTLYLANQLDLGTDRALLFLSNIEEVNKARKRCNESPEIK